MNAAKLSLVLLAACSAPAVGRAASFDIGVNFGGPVHEEVIVRENPPPPRAEGIPLSPGPGFFWVEGHWKWREHHARHWEWEPGRWVLPPHGGMAWVGGYWEQRHGGLVWVEGHWQAAYVQAPMPPPTPPMPVATPPPMPPAPPATAVVEPAPAQADVVVTEELVMAPPPPLRYEVIPRAPGREWIWIGGHWGWRNHRWEWVGGRFERHPNWHEGAGWIGGRWENHGHGYVWVEGKWR